MPSGNISLYLDCYVNGKRSYEFLKLYLIPEKTRADKEKNRETRQLAEAIRAKRIVDLRNGLYGFEKTRQDDVNFLEYYEALGESRERGKSSSVWKVSLSHLRDYCHPETIFRDITPSWIRDYQEYLDRKAFSKKTKRIRVPLSDNTKILYLDKLNACLNQAVKDEIIKANPMKKVGISIQAKESERVYLTLEEVRMLACTECRDEVIKRAFLFSCLTGLRKSDILKLRWDEVKQQGEYTRIVFKQKKTGGQEYYDISPEAVQYMGERGKGSQLVFEGLKHGVSLSDNLRRWVRAAGIEKDITFHSGRHTFAVMMLDLGVDLYTTSKLLGHRNITTTQVYAKVLDKNKQAAVSKIPKILEK